MEERLAGGMDEGAALVDGTVRRPLRRWTRTVHHLLRHLEAVGFEGAPRVLGIDERGREALSHLRGDTVGESRPWPAWTHSEAALVEMAVWLRRYHQAVADYQPPPGAVWREGRICRPGEIIGHGDPAPYNAVWAGRIVGLVDWDNAGPTTPEDDAAWVAFSWTPLHARSVVVAEGFDDLPSRRRRLGVFLDAYGWGGTVDDLVRIIDSRLETQIRVMRTVAASGEAAYVAMLQREQDLLLESARAGLASL